MSSKKSEVLHAIQHAGIIPMFNHPDLEVAKNVIDACYAGGARVMEYTLRAAFAHEEFGKLRKYISATYPDMVFGAGSVTDAAAASLAMQMGADFVVTPVFRKDIAIVCNRRRVPWAPGCSTGTEIAQAEEMGCDLIKLFPGDVLGPAFVKALLGPCPWTQVMVTGGVEPTRENLTGWFDSGVVCVGMGSKLIRRDLLETKDYASIQKLLADGLAIVRELGVTEP